MKKNGSIQSKAAVLLIIFALNTIVGFACSMGVDMGFNVPHHKGKTEQGSVHIHKDGKKHLHKTGSSHHSQEKGTGSKKDDCCKDKVVKLQSADKSLQYSKTTVNAPVYFDQKNYSRLATFEITDLYIPKYVAPHFHPPPCDIRIAIQRFQI